MQSWTRYRRAAHPSTDPDAAHLYIEKKLGSGPKYAVYGYNQQVVIRTRELAGSRVP